MSGGGGGQQSTSTTQISPEFKPYINYALSEGKTTYDGLKATVPQQLYVNPSAITSQALAAAEARANAGSPLIQAAQQQSLNTINNTGVNPFLSGALSAAYQPTVAAAQEGFRGLQGNLSLAGRYGSDAGNQLAQRAGQGFGTGIGNSMANLAYNSSEAQANRQQNAIQLAPQLGNADYYDIGQLLKVGQAQEGYDQAKINGQLAGIDAAFKPLQNATRVFYGAPLESTTTQQATPTGGK